MAEKIILTLEYSSVKLNSEFTVNIDNDLKGNKLDYMLLDIKKLLDKMYNVENSHLCVIPNKGGDK